MINSSEADMANIKSIIDFLIDVSHYPEQRKEFTEFLGTDPDYNALSQWFVKKGYVVSDEESIRILENKDRIFNSVKAKDY